MAIASAAGAAANPERNAYFGELHIHSSYSCDAYVFGTRLGPEDATKYAMGQPVVHPGGFKVQLEEPLDFTVVMDHSEYTGVFPLADDPNSPFRKNAPLLADSMRFGAWANGMDLYKVLSVSIVKEKPIKELQGPDVAGYAWNQLVSIASRYNQPGKFTTFPGWEWTATPNYKNLHRIVIFKDSTKVPPSEFSSVDATDPESLWVWMEGQRLQGNDVISIAHNGNLSDGALYPRRKEWSGIPINAGSAKTRMQNEPVTEIAQVKGQSETTPYLSPEDEFADFNVFVWMLLGAKGTPTDYGSYARLALRDGIAMQGALGFNPYKFGFVAGSDSHSAASAYRQDNYFGEHGTFDCTPEKRLSPTRHLNMDNRMVCPAGLTGVWAEENTRDSLWKAVHRKETFATSGLRMKVRLFGGWEADAAKPGTDGWLKSAYARGVAMGGDLPAKAAKAPTFSFWASKDATGPNLDRIQIIKGWAKNGQSFEKIYDVAWAGDRKPDADTGKLPRIGSTVDVAKATYTNTIGAPELQGTWTDPDFDPALDAFYYARVIAIPVPRWSTIDAALLGQTPPSVVPLSVQERAWSSPIWYTPTAEARGAASPGVKVDDLTAGGASQLTSDELRAFIVGKTVHVRNLVTGQRFELVFGTNGQRLVTSIDGKTPSPEVMGDLMFDQSTAYEIADNRLITTLNRTPFETTVYRSGDRYLASKSDEFGFANYEVKFTTE